MPSLQHVCHVPAGDRRGAESQPLPLLPLVAPSQLADRRRSAGGLSSRYAAGWADNQA